MGKFRKKRQRAEGPPVFDREGFFLGVGVGGGCAAVGALIGWAVLTAPSGGPSARYALSTSQRIARLLPQSIQNWIALILAGLFVLFGTAVFMMGIWTVIQYMVARRKAKPPE
ncbi:MAG: hypothetical protein ABT940_08310 [Alphaproteobacteria bacterium]